MGIGYYYTCKCKDAEALYLGEGMLSPAVCRETWEKMAGGDYGQRFQKLTEKYPDSGLDCENVIYVCDCGHWEVDTKKTLYKLGDGDHRWVESKVAAIYYHKCPECGKRMRQADEQDVLKCPKCREIIKTMPGIIWD